MPWLPRPRVEAADADGEGAEGAEGGDAENGAACSKTKDEKKKIVLLKTILNQGSRTLITQHLSGPVLGCTVL